MADSSLDDIIRRRGLRVKGRPSPSARPVVGGIKSRIGDQFVNLSTSWPVTGFQRTFDARQKIGITDARQRLTMRDARERLGQKDMRSKIIGSAPKVLDAREMINSRKGQEGNEKAPVVKKVLDARERLSARRSVPAASTAPTEETVNTGGRITKTFQVPQKRPVTPVLSQPLGMRINVVNDQSPSQVLEEEEMEEEEEEILHSIPVTNKPMKIGTVTNHLTQKRPGFTASKLSLGKTVPLTKVVQNDTYTAPPPPPLTLTRSRPPANVSRTAGLAAGLAAEQDPADDALPLELNLSPLEGTKMTVNNLHPRVTEEDIVELFCVCGALKRARLIHPGVAEVVFVRKDDAITAYKKYNNRCLDGQPMKCNLHVNGNVITSEQPILLRLSDTPVLKKSEIPRAKPRPSNQPPAEVDPETVLKALFKSSGPSTSAQPTAFKIKL
ncbi:polymerase delta-interacting protein 3 isoform X2 [Carcharodon carcharias]|uniref:polymerase delta-interacting protein 3 isoform X2 n=1 Tax=Carcharodon carcharias TaxID=13397 RepID=UPI001B7E9B34|nr:polymerase delta-interacting protein 3 isoform X2 [Carcharodon carcharias]